MEPDRYKNNHILYILGLICLITALVFFFFSLYVIPYLIWKLNYTVPDMITYLMTIFEEKYDFSPSVSKILTWLAFFIPSLITGFFSYYITNTIENQIYQVEPEVNEEETRAHSLEIKQNLRESAGIGIKIILLMIVIVVIILLLQLFIQLTA